MLKWKRMDILSAEWKAIVKKGAQALEIDLGQEQLDMLAIHADEVLKWNRVSNLTAIKDPHEVAVKHVIDSLAAVRYIRPPGAVLDIGTGGGFPGIPLKICHPDLKVVLVDASRKKVSFLKHVIRTLKLDGIEACHARAEVLSGEPAFSGMFDTVTCRAFSGLDKFVPMAEPYLKEGGRMVAMKGRDIDGEMALLKGLSSGGEKDPYGVELIRYTLPLDGAPRAVFVIKRDPASISIDT